MARRASASTRREAAFTPNRSLADRTRDCVSLAWSANAGTRWTYRDLGPTYRAERARDAIRRNLVKRLQRLNFDVTVHRSEGHVGIHFRQQLEPEPQSAPEVEPAGFDRDHALAFARQLDGRPRVANDRAQPDHLREEEPDVDAGVEADRGGGRR